MGGSTHPNIAIILRCGFAVLRALESPCRQQGAWAKRGADAAHRTMAIFVLCAVNLRHIGRRKGRRKANSWKSINSKSFT